MKKKVLLFNFFGGILRRGIPLYVDNLAEALRQAGVEAREVHCPGALARLPRPIINVLFVLTEQFVVPIYGLGYDKTIYPYNSVSIFATVFRKSAVVIHDFIPNRSRARSLASWYIRVTQTIHSLLAGDLIYASRRTMRIGQRGHKFPRSRIFCFPNAFYRQIALRSTIPPVRSDAVLLCTGWGTHKDLPGALKMYLDSGLYRIRRLNILGLAGRSDAALPFFAAHPQAAAQITILPTLDDEAVVRAYESSAWVWIHSLKEGFGRCLAEARLCSCRVVATDIAPFRDQCDEATYLYSGLNEFESAVATCEAAPRSAPPRAHFEHGVLTLEITKLLGCH